MLHREVVLARGPEVTSVSSAIVKKVLGPDLYVTFAYPCLILMLVLLSIPTGRTARGAAFSEQSPLQTTAVTAATKAGASMDAAQSLVRAIAITVTERAKLTPPRWRCRRPIWLVRLALWESRSRWSQAN